MTSDVTIDSGAARRTGRVGLASAGLSLGVLLSVLDQTVVATALPEIAADVGGLGSIGWVATAYLLASTATGALYGRVSDRFGRRATYLAAVGLFTVASALCALAGGLGQLIAFRALQGIGAGGLFVLPLIALSELFSADRRGRVQAARPPDAPGRRAPASLAAGPHPGGRDRYRSRPPSVPAGHPGSR